MSRLILALLVLMSHTTPVVAAPVTTKVYTPAADIIKIEGLIDHTSALGTVNSLLRARSQRITILINSTGGVVDAGNLIIDVMQSLKAHGVSVECVVTESGKSMAFIIFTHCSKRYALPTAIMMMHEVRMVPPPMLTSKQAKEIAKEIDAVEIPIRKALYKNFPLKRKLFDYHYGNATYLTGTVIATLLPG